MIKYHEKFPMHHCEIVMHPRAYVIQFDMCAVTSGFPFLQNQRDGGQPIAIFNSLDQSCEFFWRC